MALQDISRAGDVLVNLMRRQVGVVFRGPGDSRETNLAWHDGTQVVDISSDGKAILINDTLPGGRAIDAFYLRKTDGSAAIRLGEGTANVFSPDGKWVLAEPKGSTRTLVMVPTGAGETRTIPVPIDLSQWWFFPDGRRILVSGILPNGRTRLFSVDLDGKSFRQVAPDDVDTFLGEMPISPDGKLIVAQGGSEHGGNVLLYPADGGAPRPIAGFELDDVVIRWGDDGHSLFVFKRNQLPAPVFRLDIVTGKRTPWLDLMPADPAGVTRIPIVVMTPDGRSYAYVLPRELSDLYRIGGLE
jgi:dipeptidyl aminopeptidase/acylaminoacyl peptidase